MFQDISDMLSDNMVGSAQSNERKRLLFMWLHKTPFLAALHFKMISDDFRPYRVSCVLRKL